MLPNIEASIARVQQMFPGTGDILSPQFTALALQYAVSGMLRALCKFGDRLCTSPTQSKSKKSLPKESTSKSNGEKYITCLRISRQQAYEAALKYIRELLPLAQLDRRLICHPFLLREETISRIADLAADNLFSEALCPDLLLAPDPVNLPSLPVHALIFSSMPFIANELYPLMIDAYVTDLRGKGRRTFQVVGIHKDWLACLPQPERSRQAGIQFIRAIIFDDNQQVMVETEVADAPPIASAQVLSLNLRYEHQHHLAIVNSLPGITLVNPPSGAAMLDHKVGTCEIWRQAGLPTPRLLWIQPHTTPTIAAEQLTAFREYGDRLYTSRFQLMSNIGENYITCPRNSFVLKPLNGTEGQGVEFVDLNDAGTLQRVAQELANGKNILMEEHGTLRCAGTDGPVRFTIRINICWDGMRAWAESGFAQVAAAPDQVASTGRGGHIISLPDLWRHIQLPDGSACTLTGNDWQRLLRIATDGAAAIAQALGKEMPGLLGIDLLLDVDEQQAIQPILLEANPRPAGMSHSRFITPDGPTNEPGVTLRLWETLKL